MLSAAVRFPKLAQAWARIDELESGEAVQKMQRELDENRKWCDTRIAEERNARITAENETRRLQNSYFKRISDIEEERASELQQERKDAQKLIGENIVREKKLKDQNAELRAANKRLCSCLTYLLAELKRQLSVNETQGKFIDEVVGAIEQAEAEVNAALDAMNNARKKGDTAKPKNGKNDGKDNPAADEKPMTPEEFKEGTVRLTSMRQTIHDLTVEARKLNIRLKKNSQNSSIPTSKDNFRGVVTNGRKKTGNPPGAPIGHDPHGRKQLPANVPPIHIPTPEEILNDPNWYKTGVTSRKMVGIKFIVVVQEYFADTYRNRVTGKRFTPKFPPNCVNEINYDASIKALIFYLRMQMRVSEENIRLFFVEATGGVLNPSRGMINGITAQFQARTKREYAKIFRQLCVAKVEYVDLTSVRLNGKLKNIVACTDKDVTYYAYREHKGDEAIKGTPVELNKDATLVHDHDVTFYHYGTQHQECLVHISRYLLASVQIEEELTWAGLMKSLIQDMIDTREKQKRILTEEQIADFERRYDKVLAIGDKEYEEHPPGDDYRDGFNLLCRLHDKEHTLLFLRNPDVDTSNNCCERALRVIKRMLATMGTFRGDDPFSIDMYCAALSVFMSYIHGDDEVLGGLEQIFSIEAVDPRTTRRREKKQKAGTPGAAQSKPAEASGDSQEPESDAASASCSA